MLYEKCMDESTIGGFGNKQRWAVHGGICITSKTLVKNEGQQIDTKHQAYEEEQIVLWLRYM